MAFRSIATSNDDSVVGITVSPPAGIQNGDILIAFCWSDSQTNSITWPSGFVELTGTPVVTTADSSKAGCALKIASSESGSYAIGSDDQIIGGIICMSGREASTTPHRSSTNNQNTAQSSAWSISSAAFSSNTGSTCDMILIADSDITSAHDVDHSAASSGMTERADLVGTNNQFINGAVYTLDAVASGANGVYTVTGTFAAATAGWSAIMIALADIAAGSATGIPIAQRATRIVPLI